MSDHIAERPQIAAAELVKRLIAEDEETKDILELSQTTITGDFRLRHLTIKKAIDIQECDFEGDVDLLYCEFLQTVNFSNCIFHGQFNTGNKMAAHTLYRKDLIGDGATFKAGGNFRGIRCDGSAVFRGTKFINDAQEIDFQDAFFGRYLICDEATFNGGANFSNISCGKGGSFSNSRFVSESHIIEFSGSCWGPSLDCQKATFNGGATFNSSKCDIAGLFINTRFNHADKEIDFRFASFGIALVCTSAVFKGGATFNSLKCNSHADFTEARFENKDKEIDFSFSYYGVALQCVNTVFEGGAILNTINCLGKGDFEGVHFNNKDKIINFKFSYFANNLRLPGALLNSRVDLDYSQIGASFNLGNIAINNKFSLKYVSMKRLVLGDSYPLKGQCLDLRECTFGSFEEIKKHWRQFVASQAEEAFSRDPYLQLEKHFQSIGDDIEAKRVYFAGRCAISEYAKRKNTNVMWSFRRKAGDFLLKWLTGYGVKTHRLSLPIFCFIFLGVLVFWNDDALKVVEQNGNKTTIVTPREPRTGQEPVSEQPTTSRLAVLELPQTFSQRFLNRLIYSVDLFVPVIKLEFADKVVPASPWREKYATFHRIAGWFFIPLLVASWSGIVRRQ
jgi:hypothetical protein